MSATIITDDTCQTCQFKVRNAAGKLECHGAPPQSHPIVVTDAEQARVVGVIAIWPEVQPHDFCGMHPKRRLRSLTA